MRELSVQHHKNYNISKKSNIIVSRSQCAWLAAAAKRKPHFFSSLCHNSPCNHGNHRKYNEGKDSEAGFDIHQQSVLMIWGFINRTELTIFLFLTVMSLLLFLLYLMIFLDYVIMPNQ